MKLTMEQQNKLIEKEKQKLLKLISEISDDKKELAERLIDRISFMTITLEILEDDIKEKGPTYLFEQGKQRMYVENPSQKSYNTMINRYNAACNSFVNLLPKGNENSEDDGFLEFVTRR